MSCGRTMRLFLAAALTLAVVLPAQAQQRAGVAVTGSVTDESGAALPGANVQLTGPSVNRFQTTGGDGKYAFSGVPAGAYKIAVTLTGFNPVTQNVTVAETGASVPAATLRIAQLTEQVVVTASRSEAELLNAPATISVIGNETIQASPAQNYGDLLRSVPGLNVIQTSNRDVNMTSRQGTSTLSNSQLALLDGRSIYLDFFGLILWDFVPSNPADIKQIEVVRGPASAVWGANALTGVVNIITKSPREVAAAGGNNVTLSAGTFDRNTDTSKQGAGTSYGAYGGIARAPNDTWSFKLSAGYFHSDPFARPTGQIPVIPDPRGGTGTVGGSFYPPFENSKTSQPKVDLRVDQELKNGGRITYSGGYAGTEGIVHSGIGPFDIQSGSYMSYGRVAYGKGAFRLAGFMNRVDAEAPNLLTVDAVTGRPVQLNFKTDTYDLEIGNSNVIGGKNIVSYGGNVRRNNFDITITPNSEDRTEYGAYLQDEILLDRFRFSLGGRVDKFANLPDPIFSPRVSVMVKPGHDHSIRLSYNKAFRSPSVINNFIDVRIQLTDAQGKPIVFPLGAICQLNPALCASNPAVARQTLPLSTRLVGSDVSVPGSSGRTLKEEALTAYELAYTGNFGHKATVGLAFYINDTDNNINFISSPATIDRAGLPALYSSTNPPPGWPFPAFLLDLPALQAAAFGRVPATFTYLNLGPIRQKGFEASLDYAFNADVTGFVNYSYQNRPKPKDAAADQIPYPQEEIGLPAKNRFNAGISLNGDRLLGSVTVNYADKAFWSDVLTPSYHGFTDAYTLVSATVGVKWNKGRVITSIKSTNILNQDIQQHIFGDVLKRSVVGEVRFRF